MNNLNMSRQFKRYMDLSRLSLVMVLVALLLCPSVQAAEQKIIKKIDIINTKRTNPDMIKRRMHSKEGDVLIKEELVEDLHRIYEMGFFQDVRRFLTEEEDGYHIEIFVKERDYVTDVMFEGNKEIKARALQKTVKTKPHGFLLKYFVEKRDIELIKKLYVDKSFFNVEVTSSVVETEEGVVVVYRIKENERARIREVIFIGNDSIPVYEFKRVMETDFYGFLPDRIYREKILRNDIENIKRHYRNNGFLEISVDYRIVFASKETLPPQDTIVSNPTIVQKYGGLEIGIHVFIIINEGTRYKIGKVDIVGNHEEIMPVSKIKDVISLKKESTYSMRTIRGDLQKIRRLYGGKGYAFAYIRFEEEFDFLKREVNISYHVTEGGLYYIQDIEVIGNTNTKIQVILREIEISKGEKYDYSKVRDAEMFLYKLGLFKKVSIREAKGSSDDLVIIVVEVEETRTGALQIMLSYDEFNGLAGTVIIEQKNFDILGMFKGHFTGAGHDLSLRYFKSPVRKELSFNFKNARIFDGKNSFGISIADRTSEYTSYSEDSDIKSFFLGRELFKHFNMSIGFTFKDIEIIDVDASTAPPTILEEEGLSKIRSVSVSGRYNRVLQYVPFFPGSGYSLWGSAELASDFWDETDIREFIAVKGGFKIYKTLHERADGGRTVLSVTLSGQAANEMGDETAIPLSERSWLGGTWSVRGYAWYSIGPYVDGYNVKGDANLRFSVEVNYPLKWDPVQRRNLVHLVFYYDGGGVWSETGEALADLKNFDLSDMRTSIGWGFRLYPAGMPIPIELYWSYPFARKGDLVSRFQIGIFGMPF